MRDQTDARAEARALPPSPFPGLLRPPIVIAVTIGTLLAGASAPAGAAPTPGSDLAPLAALRSPIDSVLVYSDQARVFRLAAVKLPGGEARVALATLPDAARRETVRVTCSGAEVLGAEVVLTRRRLERQQRAAALLAQIERIAGEQRLIGAERAILEREISFINSLRLGALPRAPNGRLLLPAGLFVGSWRTILSWSEGRVGRARARQRALAERRRKLVAEAHKARTEAEGLDLGRLDAPAWQVVARLRGRGAQKVKLSYLVDRVRWVPSYDLRYDPEKRRVRADYYATVRQQTGEDWQGAKLRFSTTLPTVLLAVPELPTWTLGRKRDFTPKPRPRLEPSARRWQPPAPATAADPLTERLRAALGPGSPLGDALTGKLGGVGAGRGAGARDDRRPHRPRPRPKKAHEARRESLDADDEAEAAPRQRYRRYRPSGATFRADRAPAPSAAPPPPPSPPARVMSRRSGRLAGASTTSGRWGRRSSTPREAVPWTDVGYQPPRLDPDLPAAAAQGYRFELYAPGRHGVAADGKDRRVPLLRKKLSVKVVHRIVPGRSKAAYVAGVLRNDTGRPILRGHANLFSGTMFSGRSWLNTALPGRELKLPLGIDDGVKVVRHLKQRTLSTGVVFKDDVTEYTVAIEVANNHRRSIEVELLDQVPLELGKKIEIKSFSGPPGMTKPDTQGRVRWRGKVKGGAVKKLAFKFQIVRPKDWELQQHGY